MQVIAFLLLMISGFAMIIIGGQHIMNPPGLGYGQERELTYQSWRLNCIFWLILAGWCFLFSVLTITDEVAGIFLVFGTLLWLLGVGTSYYTKHKAWELMDPHIKRNWYMEPFEFDTEPVTIQLPGYSPEYQEIHAELSRRYIGRRMVTSIEGKSERITSVELTADFPPSTCWRITLECKTSGRTTRYSHSNVVFTHYEKV